MCVVLRVNDPVTPPHLPRKALPVDGSLAPVGALHLALHHFLMGSTTIALS